MAKAGSSRGPPRPPRHEALRRSCRHIGSKSTSVSRGRSPLGMKSGARSRPRARSPATADRRRGEPGRSRVDHIPRPRPARSAPAWPRHGGAGCMPDRAGAAVMRLARLREPGLRIPAAAFVDAGGGAGEQPRSSRVSHHLDEHRIRQRAVGQDSRAINSQSGRLPGRDGMVRGRAGIAAKIPAVPKRPPLKMCAAAWLTQAPMGDSGEAGRAEAAATAFRRSASEAVEASADAEEIDEARDAVGLGPVDGEVGGRLTAGTAGGSRYKAWLQRAPSGRSASSGGSRRVNPSPRRGSERVVDAVDPLGIRPEPPPAREVERRCTRARRARAPDDQVAERHPARRQLPLQWPGPSGDARGEPLDRVGDRAGEQLRRH